MSYTNHKSLTVNIVNLGKTTNLAIWIYLGSSPFKITTVGPFFGGTAGSPCAAAVENGRFIVASFEDDEAIGFKCVNTTARLEKKHGNPWEPQKILAELGGCD